LKDTNQSIARDVWLDELFKAGVVAIQVAVIWLILVNHSDALFEWAGFTAYTNASGEVVRGKTLWDWLGLFIIPVTLTLSGLWFTKVQKDRDNELSEQRAKEKAEEEKAIENDRLEEIALQTYLDQMSKLLINEELASTPKPATSAVARSWTLTMLRRLNGERKGRVVRFLYESKLIHASDPVISLESADLSEANLEWENLRSASLRGANLEKVKMKAAKLHNADLTWTKLDAADLFGASLHGAELREAGTKDTIVVFAKYTTQTVWPDNFDAVQARAILVNS
jgi:uncharacterized protein YjbI with pentapeptide repeats